LHLFWGEYDSGGSWKFNYSKYSDNDGGSWSANFACITFAGVEAGATYGRLMELDNGNLIMGGYWYLGGVYYLGYLRSIDRGVSWTRETIISTAGTYTYAEPSLLNLGDGKILCVCRKVLAAANTCFHQFFSPDNMGSWTDQGDTVFDTWLVTASRERHPFITMIEYYGKKIIACYYVDTSDQKFKVVYAKHSDFETLGVNAWIVSTIFEIMQLEEYSPGAGYTRDGHQMPVHKYNLWGAIGQIYTEHQATPNKSDISFFWTPLSNRDAVINTLYL
jgi:hypothetical protein